MKDKILAAAKKHQQLILDAERYIWNNPEPGYREWKTHRYLKERYEALGYTLTEAGNIPGFYTDSLPNGTLLLRIWEDYFIYETHRNAAGVNGWLGIILLRKNRCRLRLRGKAHLP